MKKARRLSVALVISLSQFLAGSAQAQIPVTDAAHIGQSIANHVESIMKYVEQITKLKEQLDQMKQQYDALTGIRNLGEILNNPKFKDYLPADWQGVYDSVRSGGYSGLTGSAKSIYDAAKRFDACEAIELADQKVSCQARAVKGAQDKAFAMESFDKAKDRLSQIESLMRSINTTNDPKGIAELQARIGAEQAAIQNEQTKLQMYQMIASAEDRIQRQQQREINARTWAAKGYGGAPAPMTFSK